MQTLNQLIAESVDKKDLKTLEQEAWNMCEVIEHTSKNVENLVHLKQAVRNLHLINKWIMAILEW